MPKTVSRTELLRMKGWISPPSEYFEIDQARIDAFAEVTEDRQFIHVDAKRAARTPFRGTIAHGFLTLSLVPHLVDEISVAPEGTAMAINYGLDKVRFLEPVRPGSRIRARLEILEVTEKSDDRILVSAEVTVEIAGRDKPALVAEALSLFVAE